MHRGQPLFSRTSWFDVREARNKTLRDEIDSLDSNRLVNTSVDSLCEYFQSKSQIDVAVLHRVDLVIDQHETKRQVDDYGRQVTITTTEIEVTVPFEGTSESFGVQPTTSSMNLPHGVVVGNTLTFWVDAYQRDEERIRKEIERTLDLVESQLRNLRADVKGAEGATAKMVRELIEARRTKVLADSTLVNSLGYKLKERSGVPKTYAPPEVRRKIAPSLPPAGSTAARPEPALAEADYDHILKVLSDMALVIERSPTAFKDLGEEALRFLFLVPLNGHYEGAASGEVFNYNGKTDILIRVDGKNIFIAECKFWSGPKKLTETIDQLLGYTSWRDTKTAVILFNRNKGFSKVLEAIPPEVAMHPNYVRRVSRTETSFRYIFSHPSDTARQLTLTVMAFDVPQP